MTESLDQNLTPDWTPWAELFRMDALLEFRAAFAMLNAINEQGVPEVTATERELPALATSPALRSQTGIALNITCEPNSPECQINLAQTSAPGKLTSLTPLVDVIRGGKIRELSVRPFKKALFGPVDKRCQEFLQIVQISEFSSLGNTLDNSIVAFIRQALD